MLKQGTHLGDKAFKVHLDGYNLLPNLSGEAGDDADLAAPRVLLLE
jgi:hypothetical protein